MYKPNISGAFVSQDGKAEIDFTKIFTAFAMHMEVDLVKVELPGGAWGKIQKKCKFECSSCVVQVHCSSFPSTLCLSS